jgi:hypothetical protein
LGSNQFAPVYGQKPVGGDFGFPIWIFLRDVPVTPRPPDDAKAL